MGWNSPEIKPCTCGQIILTRISRSFSGDGQYFQKLLMRELFRWYPHGKRMKLNHYLTLYTKINSKLVHDASPNTILRKKHDTFSWIWMCQWFLRYDVKGSGNKRKKQTNELGFIKIKIFVYQWTLSTSWKYHLWNGGIFANYIW